MQRLQPEVCEAMEWGRFVQIAEAMYVPGITNPSQPGDFPDGWQIVWNLNVEPVLECMKQTEHIGFVAKPILEQGKLLIVFRGSQSFLDFVDDFEFTLEDFTDIQNGGKTERGFTGLYQSLSFVDPISGHSQSLNDFLKVLRPESRFVVTGYSLGATLATLIAVVLASKNLTVDATLFASPMVGDAAFARTFQSFVHRSCNIINKPDIVPHLPGSLIGYAYTPDVFEINSLCFHDFKQSLSSFHSLNTYLSVLHLMCIGESQQKA